MSETVRTLTSAHLQNERPIWVRPPREPSSARNLAVILDGEFYREHVDASAVLDALQGKVADSWIVFVSLASAEARWLECPCHPPFAAFVVEELLVWLGTLHPETMRVRQRVLIGLSYTGLAAAFVARQYPGVFQKVVSQSGSFWWNDCWLVEQFRVLPPVPTEFYLEVGSLEVKENVRHREDLVQVVSQVEGVRRFRDVLRSTGHSVCYREFEGGHDFAAWRRTLPEALMWALPAGS